MNGVRNRPGVCLCVGEGETQRVILAAAATVVVSTSSFKSFELEVLISCMKRNCLGITLFSFLLPVWLSLRWDWLMMTSGDNWPWLTWFRTSQLSSAFIDDTELRQGCYIRAATLVGFMEWRDVPCQGNLSSIKETQQEGGGISSNPSIFWSQSRVNKSWEGFG